MPSLPTVGFHCVPATRACAWHCAPCTWCPRRLDGARSGTLWLRRAAPRGDAAEVAAGALASAPWPTAAGTRDGAGMGNATDGRRVVRRQGGGNRSRRRNAANPGSNSSMSRSANLSDAARGEGSGGGSRSSAFGSTNITNRSTTDSSGSGGVTVSKHPKRARRSVGGQRTGAGAREQAYFVTDTSGSAAKNKFDNGMGGTAGRRSRGPSLVSGDGVPDTASNVQHDRRTSFETSSRRSSFSADPSSVEGHPHRKRIPALAMLLHGGEAELREGLAEIASGTVDISVQEFNDVLSTLGRHRRIRAAIGLMRISENSRFGDVISSQRNVKTFTIMIDIYGKARQLSRAFSLFYGMQREGFQPNTVTYNAMVAACARNNEPDLAYEVFEEMEASGLTADKFTYGSLIDSCAKCGQVERAFEISALMDANSIVKDQTIYSALMDACGRVQQLDRAIQVFEEMKRKGVWPNLITFAVLIDTCANVCEPYKAFELFSEIKYWDLEPNVVTYTALIDACSKAGWPERAEIVLRKMRENGVEPNEITYGALVDAWARRGELDQAFELLERMGADDGVAPNAVLLGGLVDACRRVKDGTRMAHLWRIVTDHNIRPARVYYPSMISLAAYDGDVDTAISIAAHGYARGLFWRSSCISEDPTLRSLAYSIICLRQVIRHLDHPEQAASMEMRIRPILDAMALKDSWTTSISVADAFEKSNAVLEWARSTSGHHLPDEMETKTGACRVRAPGNKYISRKSTLDSAIARKAKEDAMRPPF
jgi:pentatricopeptide repeat protein